MPDHIPPEAMTTHWSNRSQFSRISSLALFEITNQPDGRLPVSLLKSIYRASEHGRYILALHSIGWIAIDQALDELVHSLPLNIPGVLYVDISDENALLEAVSATAVVYAASDRFRLWGEMYGLTYSREHEVLPGFAALTRSGAIRADMKAMMHFKALMQEGEPAPF